MTDVRHRSANGKLGRWALASVTAAALAITAAGCSAEEPGSPGPAENYEIHLGLPADSFAFAPLYLAESLGFYDQAGVTVTRDIVGGVAITQLASGQIDVIATGAPSALPVIEQGRQVQLTYGLLYGAPNGIIVTADSPAQTVEDLAGKKVAVLSATGIGAGALASINNFLTGEGLDPMEIVVVGDGSAMSSLLESEQVDAISVAYDPVATQLIDERYRFLYHGTNPEQVIPGLDRPIIATTVQALKTNIEAKSEAFARFTAALKAADEWAAEASTEEVVEQLMKVPAFQALDAKVASNIREYYAPILSSAGLNGAITREDWDGSLVAMKSFGLGLELQNEKFSFENVVNMAPLEAGEKLLIEFTAP